MLQQFAPSSNPIRNIWSLGYRTLVSVLPPDAEVSEHSALHKRMLAGEDPRGKAPGRRRRDGKWSSYDFTQEDPTEADLDVWLEWGAGCGIRCGDGLVAVDIDTTDKAAARLIYELAQAILGSANVRFGNRPKALLLYATEGGETFPYRKVRFSTATEDSAHVELMTGGKHFVAYGVHPKTGKPYHWPEGIPARNDLSEISQAQMAEFLNAVAENFAGVHDVSGDVVDRTQIDQQSLRGDLDLLRSAMRDLPNSDEAFPSRNAYLSMGYALKAAFGPENEEEALELFHQWCGRWDRAGERNDPEIVEQDWGRMKPPFSLGADYIYRKAEELGDWTGRAEQFFTPQEMEGEPHHLAAAQAEMFFEPIRTSTFQPLSILHGLEVPDREWVVPDLIPDRTVTMLSGDGGTGKSLIAQQLAAAAVLGKNWLGNRAKQGRVIVISAEDDEDELHRRFSAITAHYGASISDMDGLIFRSLAGEDAVLGAPQGKAGLIKPTSLFAELEAEATKQRPVLIVLDTLADLFGGSEIDRVQTRQFVGLLRGLALRCECAVLLLSHPSVAGMQSGSGTSGSTAWSNSVRSRLYMERIVEDGVEPNPDARRLTTKKANYGRTGGVIGLAWADGVFVQDDAVAGGTGPLAALEANAKAQAVFLKSLRSFAEQGRFVSASPGPTYAPAAFVKAGKSGGMTKKSLAAAMEALLQAGRIKVERHGSASRARSHLVEADPFGGITPDATSGSGGVFE